MTALYDVQRISQVGAVEAGSVNTTLSAAATANTKGAYVEITSSTGHDADILLIQLGNNNADDYLIDVAIGAAASEQIIFANLHYSMVQSVSNLVMGAPILLPFRIPAGTRISARCQATTLSSIVRIGIHLMQSSALSSGSFETATTYGANTADSGGVSVDPGAVANTKGAYSQITAATTKPIRWLIVCVGNQNNATRQAALWLFDIAIGAAASEQIIVSNLHLQADEPTDSIFPSHFAFPVSIPVGNRLAMRSQNAITDASDRLCDFVILGVS